MVLPIDALASTLTQPQALQTIAKGLMIGGGFIGPCIGMGIVGGNYIQATGRNPEAKLLGQALVFVALIELYALLAFASIFIVA
ncbi:MAG: hypothetical protein ACREGF_03860 [Candidatus Saccharimonadales bacterium]